MTNSEKLYKFYEDNPTASNDDVMKGLDWESMRNDGLSIAQLIDISREIRTILKEVV